MVVVYRYCVPLSAGVPIFPNYQLSAVGSSFASPLLPGLMPLPLPCCLLCTSHRVLLFIYLSSLIYPKVPLSISATLAILMQSGTKRSNIMPICGCANIAKLHKLNCQFVKHSSSNAKVTSALLQKLHQQLIIQMFLWQFVRC